MWNPHRLRRSQHRAGALRVLNGLDIFHPLTAPRVRWEPHLPPVPPKAQLPVKIPGQAALLTQQEPCPTPPPPPPRREVNEKTNAHLMWPVPLPTICSVSPLSKRILS